MLFYNIKIKKRTAHSLLVNQVTAANLAIEAVENTEARNPLLEKNTTGDVNYEKTADI